MLAGIGGVVPVGVSTVGSVLGTGGGTGSVVVGTGGGTGVGKTVVGTTVVSGTVEVGVGTAGSATLVVIGLVMPFGFGTVGVVLGKDTFGELNGFLEGQYDADTLGVEIAVKVVFVLLVLCDGIVDDVFVAVLVVGIGGI